MVNVLELVDQMIGLGNIEAAVASSVEVKLELMHRAEEVRQFWVDYWESFDHPHSREHTLRSGYIERPGDYSKSITVKFIEASGGHMFMARVTAHDYKAHWIEYGSSRMPEFAPRAATLSHFGGETSVN